MKKATSFWKENPKECIVQIYEALMWLCDSSAVIGKRTRFWDNVSVWTDLACLTLSFEWTVNQWTVSSGCRLSFVIMAPPHTHTHRVFFHTPNEIEIWQCYKPATAHLALRQRPVFDNFQKVKAEIWKWGGGVKPQDNSFLCPFAFPCSLVNTSVTRTAHFSHSPPGERRVRTPTETCMCTHSADSSFAC